MDEYRKEVQTDELGNATRLFIDETVNNPSGPTVLVGARDIGPIRALYPLALALEPSRLSFYTDDEARNELIRRGSLVEQSLKRFSLEALELNPDIVLTSGEVNPAIDNTLTFTYGSPTSNTVIVWLEDVEGSLRNRRGMPDIVFCLNKQSSEQFRALHSSIPTDRIHLSHLNPDFIRLLDENPAQTGQKFRERFNLNLSDNVVTFIGSKSSDIPEDPGTLQETAEALEGLRKQGVNIVLIRRDHPGEPKPEAYDSATESFHGTKIIMRKGNDLMNIPTYEVVCASNLLVGMSSTVFLEASFRGALSDTPGTWGTVVLERHLAKSSAPESDTNLVAYSKEQLKEHVNRILRDTELLQRIHEVQQRSFDVNNMRANFQKVVDVIQAEVRKRII